MYKGISVLSFIKKSFIYTTPIRMYFLITSLIAKFFAPTGISLLFVTLVLLVLH